MAITRDQTRARHAYERASKVQTSEEREDYKILVKGLGANIIRSGLCAALSVVERDRVKRGGAAARLLDDLGGAGIPNLKTDGQSLPGAARNLDLDDYMLATRETLKVVVWFKRAVEASFR